LHLFDANLTSIRSRRQRTDSTASGGARVIDRPERARAIAGRERLARDTDAEHGASVVGLLRAVHRDGAVEKPRLGPLQGVLCFFRLPAIDGRPRRCQEGVRSLVLRHQGTGD
jgi:hypothetical protein